MSMLQNEFVMNNLSTIMIVLISVSALLSFTMIKFHKKDEQNNTCESIKWGRILGFIFMAGSAFAIWTNHKAKMSVLVPVITFAVNALFVKASYDDVKNGTCNSKVWMKYLGYLQGAQAILVTMIYFWYQNKI